MSRSVIVVIVIADAPVLVVVEMKTLCSNEQHRLSSRFVSLKVADAADVVSELFSASARTFYVFLHASTRCHPKWCRHRCLNSYCDSTRAEKGGYLACLTTSLPIALTC